MSAEEWRSFIKEMVLEVASKDWQRYFWVGDMYRQLFSSPIEAYAGLLDDAGLERFLKDDTLGLSDATVGLSDEQKEAGWELIRAMDDYSTKYDPLPSAEEDVMAMINDQEWEKVRKVARDFLNALDK